MASLTTGFLGFLAGWCLASWVAAMRYHPKINALVVESATLADAHFRIRDGLGQVCSEFEICDHASCNASYWAWATSDAVLSATGLSTSSREGGPES